MPVAPLIRTQRFFRSAQYVPADVRVALARTLRELDEAEERPGLDDVRDILPPALPVWRRRVGASSWWVYFTQTAVVAVAVPPT